MNHDYQPITDADWPASAEDLRTGFAGKLNVYRTMAHHPALLRAWANLRQHVVIDSALSHQQSEAVILRTGHRLGIPYEWIHHVSRARKVGFSDGRIRSIAGRPEEMAPEDGMLAQAVDDLMEGTALHPERVVALQTSLGKHAVLDVIATVGFYTTLGYILKSFGLVTV